MKKLFKRIGWLALALIRPTMFTIVCTLPLTFAGITLNAQTVSLTDAYLTFSPSGANSNNGILHLEIPDTTSINSIEVSIGTSTSNSTEYLSQEFTFDQTSGLSNGQSYARNGYNITLGLGNFPIVDLVFCKIRLKNQSGNWGSYYEFMSN